MKNLQYFKEKVLEKWPLEEIGYINSDTDKYVSLENTQSDPLHHFQLSEKDSLFLVQHPTYDIIHSHTQEKFSSDPRIPSLNDMLCKQNIKNRMGIVHSDGVNVSDILYFGEISDKPYLGRRYISNISDCFTLARDYYYRTLNIDLGLHPRPADWQEWNSSYIENTYAELGFKPVIFEQRLPNDAVLFSIGATYPNHIGILTSRDIFIHHLKDRASSEDSIYKWRRQIHSILRYSGD